MVGLGGDKSPSQWKFRERASPGFFSCVDLNEIYLLQIHLNLTENMEIEYKQVLQTSTFLEKMK